MSAFRDRVRRFTLGPRSTVVVLLVTFVMTLPSIRLAFYNDDYSLLASLRGTLPNAPPSWDLYRFIPGGDGTRTGIELGAYPWWSAPGLKLHLVRPLTSLLFTLEHSVFGNAPLGYHLDSIALYVALVALAGVLFRNLLSRTTAQLATLIFAFSTAHFYPYGWISCRHMVLGALPALAGLVFFVRDPTESKRAGRWWFALGLALGLASTEAALAALGFPVAQALLARRRSLRARVATVAPALALVPIYLGLYARLGGGAHDSAGYVDPMSAPGRFVLKTLAMLPVMLANAIAAVPAEMATIGSLGPLVVLGLVLLGLIGLLVRSCASSMDEAERAVLPWLALGGVLALVPALGGFPGARVLLVSNLGFAPVLATLIRRASSGRVSQRVAAYLLVFVHVLTPPLATLGNLSFNVQAARAVERIARTAEIGKGKRRAFIIGSSDPMLTMYVPTVLAATEPERLACWCVLSGAKLSHRLTRASATELRVKPIGGTMLSGPFETLFRSPDVPLPAGTAIRQCGATFRVLAVEGERPVEVAVEFDQPLDDPTLSFLVWRDGALRHLALPAIGESLEIVWSAGPLGMF